MASGYAQVRWNYINKSGDKVHQHYIERNDPDRDLLLTEDAAKRWCVRTLSQPRNKKWSDHYMEQGMFPISRYVAEAHVESQGERLGTESLHHPVQMGVAVFDEKPPLLFDDQPDAVNHPTKELDEDCLKEYEFEKHDGKLWITSRCIAASCMEGEGRHKRLMRIFNDTKAEIEGEEMVPLVYKVGSNQQTVKGFRLTYYGFSRLLVELPRNPTVKKAINKLLAEFKRLDQEEKSKTLPPPPNQSKDKYDILMDTIKMLRDQEKEIAAQNEKINQLQGDVKKTGKEVEDIYEITRANELDKFPPHLCRNEDLPAQPGNYGFSMDKLRAFADHIKTPRQDYLHSWTDPDNQIISRRMQPLVKTECKDLGVRLVQVSTYRKTTERNHIFTNDVVGEFRVPVGKNRYVEAFVNGVRVGS